MRQASALCGLEKPSGLFNPFEEEFEDNTTEDRLFSLFMDTFLNSNEIFVNSDDIKNFEEEMSLGENANPAYEQHIQKPLKESKSKFSKRIKNVSYFPLNAKHNTKDFQKIIVSKPKLNFKINMKINIPTQPSVTSFTLSPMLIEPTQKFTPSTEKMFNQLIESIPTQDLSTTQYLDLDLDTQPPNFDLLDQNLENDVNFEKLILGCTPTPNITEMNHPFKHPNIDSVSSDHEYSSKRKFSVCSYEDSLDSSVAGSLFAESLTSSLLPAKRIKKQRPIGIYRADDVTNEDELRNYLERRKKNNISSKISRANKKRNYSEMDTKCHQLQKDNTCLEKKIAELEKLTKVIEEYLVQKIVQNK